VQLTARIRPFEPATDRTAPPGQVSRIDRAQLERALADAGLAGGVLGGYAVLATESPAPASAPTPLPRPDVDLGVHLAYAYQWWIFAVLLYLVLGVALYREAERRAAAAAVADPDNSGEGKAQAGPPDADKTPRDVTVRVEGPPSE
jgi:cytochrome oxidase assembly protein ShyY1